MTNQGNKTHRTLTCLHRHDDPSDNSALIKDLQAMNLAGQKDAVKKAIEMIAQLREVGMDSPHKKHLFDSIYELKARTKSGGIRVYFARLNENDFVLGRAECKTEDQADVSLLAWFDEVLSDIEKGRTDLLR